MHKREKTKFRLVHNDFRPRRRIRCKTKPSKIPARSVFEKRHAYLEDRHRRGDERKQKQEEERQAKKWGANERKAAATTKPKARTAGTHVCPFPKKTFAYTMHRYDCELCPYELCLNRIQTRLAWLRNKEEKRGMVWREKCPHCQTLLQNKRRVRQKMFEKKESCRTTG